MTEQNTQDNFSQSKGQILQEMNSVLKVATVLA